MGIDISRLAVVVSANTSPLATGLAAGASHVDGFVAHVDAAGSQIGGVFARMAGLAAGVLGGLSFGQGFKLAAEFEQTSVAMEVMLGSAEKAQGVLKEMKSFAASTPF